MDPLTPAGPLDAAPVAPAGQPAKPHTFKMRLTPDQADKLKSWAHENELSQADYVRFMVFARTTYAPPNASKLEAICRQLSGIATNINQAQKAINEANQSGTLTPVQFEQLGRVLIESRRLWADPLDELRDELKKIRPQADK